MSFIKRRNADYLPIRQILKARFYIPDFQRAYAWEQEEIQAFLADLEDGISDPDDTTLGPLMTYEDDRGQVNIFDGQQRMTTLFCLLLAARGLAKDKSQIFRTLEGFLYTPETRLPEPKDGLHLVHPRSYIQDLLMWIFENPGVTPNEVHDEAVRLYREVNFSLYENTTSRRVNIKKSEIGRISAAYRITYCWLQDIVGDDEADNESFIDFLLYRTMFLFIGTRDENDAQRQFERSNSRGKSLNAFDLLKNSVFHVAAREDRDEIKTIWSDMADLIERNRTKPDNMMRSAYIAGLPNSTYQDASTFKARSWFRSKEQMDFIAKNPVVFASSLKRLWEVDERMSENRDPWGNPCHELNVIRSINSRMDTLRPVLFAMLSAPVEYFPRLIKATESAVFAGSFAGDVSRDMQKTFITWTNEIANIRTQEDCDFFVHHRIGEFIRKRRPAIRQRLTTMEEPALRPTTLTILKKAAAHFDAKFDHSGKSEAERFSIYDGFEIEHILPRGHKERNDDQPCYRLGNLTLLEKSLNASVKDLPFARKKEAYKLSNCRVTKQIVTSQSFGLNTRYSSAAQNAPVFSTWDEDGISVRQGFLADLLMEAWCFDDPQRL